MPRHVSLQIDELVLQGVTLSRQDAAIFERSLVRTLDELLAQNPEWGAAHTADRVALTLDRAEPDRFSPAVSMAETLGASVGRTLAGHVLNPSPGPSPGSAPC